MSQEIKQRIVQELVPGKQITLAHIIANPDPTLLEKIGMVVDRQAPKSAIAVLTVTPAETAIILADIAMKAAGVTLGHLDCNENGSLIVTGTVSEAEASVSAILEYAQNVLRYEVCDVTRT